MKLMMTLLAATMLTIVSASAQDCDLLFEVNPDLPCDCVELAFIPENISFLNCIYLKRNIGKPEDVPDAVQVAVFATMEDGIFHFLGWSWMTADEANLMHKLVMASL